MLGAGVQAGLAETDSFTTSLKGGGAEQRFGVVIESKTPNGISAGGNTAKSVHKVDGERFQEVKDLLDGPALGGGKDFEPSGSMGAPEDVGGTAVDAIDARNERQAGKNATSPKPDTTERSASSSFGSKSHYKITQGNVTTDVYSSEPLKKR